MAHKTRGEWRTLTVAVTLASACCMAAGCHREAGGDTVPSPPRELIEQSLRKGKAPIARPVPGAPPGRPTTSQ